MSEVLEPVDPVEQPYVAAKRADDAELDITPMIDIVFLLLAFFVVVSKMDPKAATDLPVAENGQAIIEQESVTFIVGNSGNMEMPLFFKGADKENPIPYSGDPEELKTAVAAYCQERFDTDPKLNAVLIKAEQGVKTRFVHLVFQGASRYLQKNEATSQFLIHIAVEEEG